MKNRKLGRGRLFCFVLFFLAALGLHCGVRVSLVVARGVSFPATCGILVPRPGIEPASPALEGEFLTTGPPGKSQERQSETSEPQEGRR